MTETTAPFAGNRRPAEQRLRELGVRTRMAAADPGLWGGDAATPELGNRLGWLSAPALARVELPRWRQFLDEARTEGIERLLILGMGGSALAAALFAGMDSQRRVRVLDSTHPRAVERALATLADGGSLVAIASKSGTTAETRRLADLARTRLAESGFAPARHFVAVSDPGTPLERLAVAEGWRGVLATPENVGGRFSAMTAFGLFPALAGGLEVGQLIDGAEQAFADCQAGDDGNAGLALAAWLIDLAERRAPFQLADDHGGALAAWAEQLIAESLGKGGGGPWPVPPGTGGVAGLPRLGLGTPGDLHLPANGLRELGAAMATLMWATAAAGAVLGVQPFNQPDVEAAKCFAAAVERGATEIALPQPVESASPVLRRWLQGLVATPPRLLVINAFIDPEGPAAAALPGLCARLAARIQRPVVPAIGPRYLHSTGQLQKGGPADIAALLLIDEEARGSTAKLMRAQALGDLLALGAAGRRVIAVSLGPRAETTVAGLPEILT